MQERLNLARNLVAAHHAKRDELDQLYGGSIAEFEKRGIVADHVAEVLKTERKDGRILLKGQYFANAGDALRVTRPPACLLESTTLSNGKLVSSAEMFTNTR